MSDNSDLLGGAPPLADPNAKPKRGRPAGKKKAVPEALQAAAPEAAQVPVGTTPPVLLPPELAALAGALMPSGAVVTPPNPDAGEGVANAEAECSRDLSDLISTPETDGSVSVTLPPVSPEYAAATANRIRPGNTQREYAWQRLKRAGKRL